MFTLTDVAAVLADNWAYSLVILLCTVVLMGWAMYQLSKSLHSAMAVTIGMLLVAALTLYNEMRVVSLLSLTLAIGLALFYVANQWLNSSKVKEGAYDVEEKR